MAIIGLGGWILLGAAVVGAVVLVYSAVRMSGLHSEIERQAEQGEQGQRIADSVARGVERERERQLQAALRKLWRSGGPRGGHDATA